MTITHQTGATVEIPDGWDVERCDNLIREKWSKHVSQHAVNAFLGLDDHQKMACVPYMQDCIKPHGMGFWDFIESEAYRITGETPI